MIKIFLPLFAFVLLPFTGISQSSQGENAGHPGLATSVLTLVAIFVILVIGYLLMKNYARIFKSQGKEAGKPRQETNGTPSDEETAAIAMAINLYIKDLQEREKMTLTISKVSRAYSPWSSKIYSVGVLNRR